MTRTGRCEMSSKITRMPLAELVEDMDLYPRHAVDGAHVATLAAALEAGETLPPIVADAVTRRIADGWHRARGHRRVFGPECEVDVELVRYPSEAALILDAVARNATHGRRLDKVDRARSILMLRAAGFETDAIGEALRMSADRVERLTLRVADAPKSSDQVVPGTSSKVVLKVCTKHLAGKRLTKQQAKAHKTMPGTSLSLAARQLRLALDNGLADLTDHTLVEELGLLAAAMKNAMSAVA